MITNYLYSAWGFYRKNKAFLFLNLLGLAVGLACSIAIFIYIMNELNYDKFLNDYQKVFRINTSLLYNNKIITTSQSSICLASTIKKEIKEVESSAYFTIIGNRAFSNSTKTYYEDRTCYADSNFFELFPFRFIKGNPSTCLNNLKDIVLTSSAASKYFGNENPMGKTLILKNDHNDMGQVKEEKYTVTSVIEDIPTQCHFHFDLISKRPAYPDSIMKYLWASISGYTYIRVKDALLVENIQKQIDGFHEKYIIPTLSEALKKDEATIKKEFSWTNELMRMDRLHISSIREGMSEEVTDPKLLAIFTALAILLLLIACINFINISTAISSQRARETAIRKASNASQRQLFYQYITEFVLLTIFSVLIAMVLVESFQPVFNVLIGKEININYITNLWFWLFLVITIIVITALSGIYPALVLSSYKPVEILKKGTVLKPKNKGARNVLVTFQFIITSCFLLSTFAISEQMKFLSKKDLGFDKDQIIVMERTFPIKDKMESFMDDLKKLSFVKSVSLSASTINRLYNKSFLQYEENGKMYEKLYCSLFTDENFTKTMGIELLQGRYFSRDSDDLYNVVINEVAAKIYKKEALHKYIYIPGRTDSLGQPIKFKIIGIVKDFNFQSLHTGIDPLVIQYISGYYDGYVNILIKKGKIKETQQEIKKLWETKASGFPMQTFFFDDDFQKFYQTEKTSMVLLYVFSIISIILTMLGLIGLVSFSLNQRKKEIALRKSMGASTVQIVKLMIINTIPSYFVAFMASVPISYSILDYWLKTFFAYHLEINILWFLLVFILMFVSNLIIIIWQSAWVARSQTIQYLKSE